MNVVSKPPILSIRDLRTSFRTAEGWRTVVNGLSLDIARGQTVAVIGESGSGKSVTALSVMRLLDESRCRIEGKLLLEDEDLLTKSEEQLKELRGNKIAMIFQEPMTSLNPVATIGAQIGESLLLHREMSRREARIETLRLLDRVRIPSAATRIDEYPHQFSGGMRQRAMIAIALACEPRLLIADEPTTALDVTIQGQILDLLKSLQDESDMSMLFITHDMGVVAEVADKTLVMYRGDVVEQGDTRQVFDAPKHPYSRALLAAVPNLGSMRGEAEPLRFPVVDLSTGVLSAPPPARSAVRCDLPPVLSVEHLTARFDVRSGILGGISGRVHAVEDVSFQLRHGETLSIVGESGCGKSTIGRTIVRLNKPTSGRVELNGKDVTDVKGKALSEARKQMQMIFQDPFASLDPRMSIGRSIAEPMDAHKQGTKSEQRDRVDELLQRVGLSPRMVGRYPHEFSGGQRQRICIARALATAPQVMIADECVSALDASVKAQVINLLIDLQESMGLAQIFISHDMAVVERISHRIAVMYLGELVEIGPRASIINNPTHPYTQKLMAAVPVPDPNRRLTKRNFPTEALRSPMRPRDYVHQARSYRQVAPGHLVQTVD